jgi:hypothetical protein
MRRINVGHWRAQGIDYLVFDADAVTWTASDRAALLRRLKREADAARSLAVQVTASASKTR